MDKFQEWCLVLNALVIACKRMVSLLSASDYPVQSVMVHISNEMMHSDAFIVIVNEYLSCFQIQLLSIVHPRFWFAMNGTTLMLSPSVFTNEETWQSPLIKTNFDGSGIDCKPNYN